MISFNYCSQKYNNLFPQLLRLEHRRDYTTILALGDIATIEFELESVWLRSPHDTIDNLGVTEIKRFTRRKIESAAWWIAHTLCYGLYDKPYRPDLETLDYDC